jgi:hypothetical protein
MESGCSMVSLALELERQLATKRDLIVPSSLLQCHTDEGGELKMIVDTKRGDGGEYGVFEYSCIDAYHCPDVGKNGNATWSMAVIVLRCIYTYQQAR